MKALGKEYLERTNGIVIMVLSITILVSSRLVAQNSDLWTNGNMKFTIDDNNNESSNYFYWGTNGGDTTDDGLMWLSDDGSLVLQHGSTTGTTSKAGFELRVVDRESSAYNIGFRFSKYNDLGTWWNTHLDFVGGNINPDFVISGGGNSQSNLNNLTERLRITTDGRIGIGTYNPSKTLDVKSTGYTTIAFQNAAAWDHMQFTHNGVKGIIQAGGAESGIDFQMEATGIGGYKNSYNSKFQIWPDKVETKTQEVTMNYGTSSDLTKVSINTDKKVDHAALTIAGATYIGPKAELAAASSLEKFNLQYLDDYNLWVEDGIVTEDLVFVRVSQWKDEVFSDDYILKPLTELESFVKTNRHLPGIKSEKEVKKEGYSVQELNVSLLGKVEELVLYTIEQEKKINRLKEQLENYKTIKSEIDKLKQAMVSLKNKIAQKGEEKNISLK